MFIKIKNSGKNHKECLGEKIKEWNLKKKNGIKVTIAMLEGEMENSPRKEKCKKMAKTRRGNPIKHNRWKKPLSIPKNGNF